jgi:hypothetical protein
MLCMSVYFRVQCAIRAPKQYLYRVLPDSPRMAAWWNTTTAAVKAVYDSGRTPRLLLLGAKAGVLAVAALRAGAAHVTCVERCVLLLKAVSCAPSLRLEICEAPDGCQACGVSQGSAAPQ